MGLAAGQTYHSNGSATTAPFSYSGVLHIQICTRIYIVDLSTGKVLRSVALYWRPFFCGSWREKATKELRISHKSTFVVVLNITLCSLDVKSNASRTIASDKGQERR